MLYKKILTIQDISCVGQCSLTVALPILSAAGFETCILPSAVLSTHTAGFTGFTVRDLTDDIPAIAEIDDVKNIIATLAASGCTSIVDPAMADNGKLYPAFDHEYVQAMKALAFSADIILPNITEACFLTDTEYRDSYDEAWISQLLKKLRDAGAKTIVLTGVSYKPETTGVVVLEGEEPAYYEHRKIAKGCHGTGDVYASAFVGALMHGKSAYDAAALAADYTVRCIEVTQGDPAHWYGVKFELVLPEYIRMLGL